MPEYLKGSIRIWDNVWILKRKDFPKINGIICPKCGNRNLYPSADKNKDGFCKRFYCWGGAINDFGCRAEINIIDEE